MTDLERLKLLTDEIDALAPAPPAGVPGDGRPEGCGNCAVALPSARMYTDEQLQQLLELHDGDVNATAYDVLIRKAESSGLRIAGGTELPDQRAYWLGRARAVRPNATKAAGRADERGRSP